MHVPKISTFLEIPEDLTEIQDELIEINEESTEPTKSTIITQKTS